MWTVTWGDTLLFVMSHAEWKAIAGGSSMKKTIAADAIIADLKNGLSNEALAKKYGVPPNGLSRLFDEVLRAKAGGIRHIWMEFEE